MDVVYYPYYDSPTTVQKKMLYSLKVPSLAYVRKIRDAPVPLQVKGRGYLSVRQELEGLTEPTIDRISNIIKQYGKLSARDGWLLYFYLVTQPRIDERVEDEITEDMNAYERLDIRHRIAQEVENESSVQQQLVMNALDMPAFELSQAMKEFREIFSGDMDILEDSVRWILELQEKLDKTSTAGSTLAQYTTTGTSVILSAGANLEDFGEEIFDKAIVGVYLPCLMYTTETKTWFKIYSPQFGMDEPNYQKSVMPLTESRGKNKLYMTIGTLDILAGDIEYITGELDLVTGLILLDIEMSPQEQAKLIHRLNLVFKESVINNIRVLSSNAVSSSTFIYGMSYIEPLLLDEILLDETFNNFLFVDETRNPVALKKRFEIKYHPMLEFDATTVDNRVINRVALTASLTQYVTASDETVTIFGTEQTIKYPAGTHWVKVSVRHAETEEDMRNFYIIFWKLMSIYKSREHENKEAAKGEYKEEFARTLGIKPKEKEGVKATKESLLRNLRDKAPHLAVPMYPRTCQPKSQPSVITPEQAEALKFKDGKRTSPPYNRLTWPLGFPEQHIFVCDANPSRGWIGLKPNRIVRGTPHLWLPCCFKKDRMRRAAYQQLMLAYEKFYPHEIDKMPKKETAKGAVKTRKLSPTGIASEIVPPSIVTALQAGVSKHNAQFKRVGVMRTKSCFLTCVLLALGKIKLDISYRDQAPIQQQREANNIVERERAQLAKAVNPVILKQELYDVTDENITEMLGNPNVYMDPHLYYRAVEEFYQVNIFVFEPSIAKGESYGGIAFPRAKHFHYRQREPYEKTIVIYNTLGGESDAPEFPMCELIVSLPRKVFSITMYNLCLRIMKQLEKVVIWEITIDDALEFTRPSRYSYSFFQAEKLTQYVDGAGKLRAITYKYGDDEVTITTPPSQPLSIPVMLEPSRITLDTFADIFPEEETPKYYTEYGNLAIGLWVDIHTYIYIEPTPIEDVVARYPNISKGLSDPLFSYDRKDPIRELYRIKNVLIQLIRYLFEIYGGDMLDFTDRYIEVIPRTVEDTEYYQGFLSVGSHLPLSNRVEDVLKFLRPYAPEVIRDNKIVLQGDDIYEALLYMLKNKSTLQVPRRKEFMDKGLRQALVIRNNYLTVSDFIQDPDVVIFLARDQLDVWLESTVREDVMKKRYYFIRNKMETPVGYYTTPVFYRDKNGYWLIKNHVGKTGETGEAAAVADASRFISTDSNRFYTLTRDKDIEVIEEEGKGPDFREILYYGLPTKYNKDEPLPYGTMLPLTDEPAAPDQPDAMCPI